MGDWVELIERCYDLSPDDADWGHRIAEAALPLFGAGLPVGLFVAGIDTGSPVVEQVETSGSAAARALTKRIHDAAPSHVLDLVWRTGGVVSSLSERVFAAAPEVRSELAKATGRVGADFVNVSGHVDADRIVLLSSARIEETRTSPAERRCWHRAIAHVAAGCRLRRRVSEVPFEGVFEPDGRVRELRGRARNENARDALRHAVAAIDRARTSAARDDPDLGLANWQGLVSGRWSLVDRFDSDGRRFLVAIPNEPSTLDPRGLTRREAQVAELVGTGRSTKEIAYDLGLSLSTVTMAATRAARKFGLRSRAELAAFFAPCGARSRLREARIGDQPVLVGCHAVLDPALSERLTRAEREVAELVVSGRSNAEIARLRGTAQNTVANQVASIFRKLSIQSRTELGAGALPAARDSRESGTR
ncbi:MAG: LuxR C-terminal-related transcriptional regulator [Myxococcota bacterium]|nr:LuxR C-terminal-related transcriptional regulator [Myxococcota bacterium]